MVDSSSLLDRAYSCNRSELLDLLGLIEFKLKHSKGGDDNLLHAKLVVTSRLAV